MDTPHTTDAALPRPAGAPGTLMESMGVMLVEHTAERTVLTAPIEGNRQTAGILHGGASAALAETAASFAAGLHALAVTGDPAARVVGTELSISHLHAGTRGTVTATARAVHLGRTSTVHLVDITDEDGRLLSTARVTNRVLS